jgi:hypothetical protein
VKTRLRIANDPSPASGSVAGVIQSAVNLGRRRAGWWPMAEVLGFVGGAIALSSRLHPNDPLWVASSFPWLWLIAAVVALRYGALTGTAAMGLALLAWLLATHDASATAFPRLSFLGGLILVLVAGEFSDVWNARLQRERAVNAYLDERLHALTHNHFLLRLSHERLEQELIARPQTLRESLSALRKPIAQDLARGHALPGAQALLELLVQSCRLENASLHPMDRDRPAEARGPVPVWTALRQVLFKLQGQPRVAGSRVSPRGPDSLPRGARGRGGAATGRRRLPAPAS